MKISEMIRVEGDGDVEGRPTMETNRVADDLWEVMMKDKALFGIFDNPEKKINWKKIQSTLAKSIATHVPHLKGAKAKRLAESYVKALTNIIESAALETYKKIKHAVQTQIPDGLGSQ